MSIAEGLPDRIKEKEAKMFYICGENSVNHNENIRIRNNLTNMLTPLIWSMKLMGLMYSTREGDDENISKSNLSKREPVQKLKKMWMMIKRKTDISLKLYSIIVLIILLFNAIKFTVAICLHSDFALRINNLVWTWQCFLNSVILFGICHKGTILTITEKTQEKIERTTKKDMFQKLIKKQSKMIRTLVFVSWLLCSINMGYISFAMYGPFTDLNESMETIVDPLPANSVTKIMSLILHCFDTAAWVFPVTFYCIICNILNSWFELCRNNLQETIQNSPDEFPERFEEIRRNHFELCKVVCNLDRSLKYIAFVTHAFTIPIVCFLLYELLTTSMNFFGVGLSIFWMTVEASIVVALSLAGAFLHEQVMIFFNCLLNLIKS